MSTNIERLEAGTAQLSSRQTASAIIASVLGWSLDLFDLNILLFVAPVISALFFPTKSPILSLASVFAAYGVTLLMRPAGGAIFGSYADRSGRKRSMVVAVTGVGVVTALTGLLPTYARIGILAPILLILIRLVQGIFIGGVVASSHTVGTETVAPRWRGLVSGLVGSGGAGIGLVLASAAFLVASLIFPGKAFAVWGWRLMFFFGIINSLLGVFVFRYVEESPIWAKVKGSVAEQKTKLGQSPLRALFTREYFPIVLSNLLFVVGSATTFFLTINYMPTYLEVINHLPNKVAGEIVMYATIILIFVAALVGHLSEYIGRKKTFLLLVVLNIVIIPFLYIHLGKINSIGGVFLGVLFIELCGYAAISPVLVFLNERFPTAIRASGTALSWNVGFAIGGLMLTLVTLSSHSIKDIPSRLVMFLIGATVLMLIGALTSPETKGKFK